MSNLIRFTIILSKVLHSCAVYSTDIGSFWQISDIHLDLNYTSHGCQTDLGDYRCDSSSQLLASALNFMISPLPGLPLPDFIIYSGDSVSHTTQTLGVLDTMQAVSAQLRKAFPPKRVPLIVSLGNNDLLHANHLTLSRPYKESESWCHRLATEANLWGEWITNQTREMPAAAGSTLRPVSKFSMGCFYSRLISIPQANSTQPRSFLLLISLNGMLWYRDNRASDVSIDDPFRQFGWLENTLLYARIANIKALIVCHIPPGANENAPKKYRHLHPKYNQRFIQLLTDYSDVLMAGLFGHQHTDTFRVITDQFERPLVSLFISPSLSPMHTDGLGSFNPRLRAYLYSRASLQILDYHQFRLDLSHSEPSWSQDYALTDAYALGDGSAASMHGLLDRLALDHSNNSIWCSYWRRELANRESGDCPVDGEEPRCCHLCALRWVDFARLEACLAVCHLEAEIGNSRIYIIAAVIAAFLLLLVGVVLCVNREICRPSRRGGNTNSAGSRLSVNGMFTHSRDYLYLNQRHFGDTSEPSRDSLPDLSLNRSPEEHDSLSLADGQSCQSLTLRKLTLHQTAGEAGFNSRCLKDCQSARSSYDFTPAASCSLSCSPDLEDSSFDQVTDGGASTNTLSALWPLAGREAGPSPETFRHSGREEGSGGLGSEGASWTGNQNNLRDFITSLPSRLVRRRLNAPLVQAVERHSDTSDDYFSIHSCLRLTGANSSTAGSPSFGVQAGPHCPRSLSAGFTESGELANTTAANT